MSDSSNVSRRGRSVTVLASALALAGCGTFQLAAGVYPPPGRSTQEQQTDVLVCKDQARNEANTAARQAGAFALGFTIVGAPLAYEMEKSKQREVFASCMTARGYRIVPVNDGPSSANDRRPNVQTQTPSAPVSPSPSAVARDAAEQLERLESLRNRGLITEAEFQQKRKEILDRL